MQTDTRNPKNPATNTPADDLPEGFTVYHRDNAGIPEAHTDAGGPWYFEPIAYNGDVYSLGYSTKAAAIDACWDAAALAATLGD